MINKATAQSWVKVCDFIFRLPDSWLEESPATGNFDTGFLGFVLFSGKFWDGSQDSKLLLHAFYAALPI
jgi:hypothetical protein